MVNRNNLKKIVIVFFFSIICNHLVAQSQSINLLHDDFDLDHLDKNIWINYMPESWDIFKGAQNNEFKNGNLIISAYSNTDNSNNGKLYSLKPFLYGMFTLVCKRPEGKGFWPAFWLYGEQNQEVDIFEFMVNESFFRSEKLSTNIHLSRYGKHLGFGDESNMNIFEKGIKTFHKHQLFWSKDILIWIVDGFVIRIVYPYYEEFVIKGSEVDKYEGGHFDKCNGCIENILFPTRPMHLVINNGLDVQEKEPIYSYPYNALIIDYVNVCQFIPETTNVCNLRAPDNYGYWPDIFGENVIIGGKDCHIQTFSVLPDKPHPDKLNIYATKQIDIYEGFEAYIGSTVEIGLPIPYCNNNSKGNEFSDSPIDSIELEKISKEYQERIDTTDTLLTTIVQLNEPTYSTKSNLTDTLKNTDANNSNTPNLNYKLYDQILIFPNPTSDYLYMLFDKDIGNNIKIELYNSIGAKVYSKTTNYIDNYRIDLSSFAKGEYLLNILSNKLVYTNNIFLK